LQRTIDVFVPNQEYYAPSKSIVTVIIGHDAYLTSWAFPHMRDKYLLYIDVLGFRNLARTNPQRVYDLYRVVASLNVHDSDSFAAIVFSDTIIIYNTSEPIDGPDSASAVMFLCEFAQDFLYRLTGYELFFRAVLTRGPFEHYYLNQVPCFFGEALIDAYQSEKQIKATGLFIHNSCQPYNRIYATTRFDDTWSFVFLTQRMTELEDMHFGLLPLNKIEALDTDLPWLLGPEVLYLKAIYENATSQTDASVREKYSNAWSLYARRYPVATETLVSEKFSLSAVSPDFDWQQLLNRTPEDYAWASRRRNVSTPER
jgi:hypothetical protein